MIYLKEKLKLTNIDFRKALSIFMIVVIIGLGITGYKVNELKTRAFQVYLDEKSLGIVRNKDIALKVMEDIRKDLSSTYSVECVLNQELKFEITHVKDDALITEQNLKQNIQSSIDFLVAGYTISINGEEIGSVKSEKEVEFVLEKIKEPYLNRIEGEIKEVKILETVQTTKKEVPLSKVSSTSELIEHIMVGSEKIKTHIVEVGESFWTIAMMYDTTVDDLIAANPDRDPEKLKPGNEVKLVLPTSKLTVATIEEVEYNEDTAFETVVETNASMYKNEKKVKIEGQNGVTKVLASKVKHNGIVVENKIIKEEIVKEPVDQLIVKGTKEVPKTMATGILMMPTRGRLTSPYGARWGRMHKGIDIAASIGTPIKAADGGTVTFSGWQGTYGNMIEIDHGNGYKTRYAHASKLLVSKGTKVYKGQHIANVGNTGRSTGPHLHLEVLVNGTNVNPSKYVK